MSMGFGNEQLANQIGMGRGMFGTVEPRQVLDFNFGEGGLGGPFANPMIGMVLQPLINQIFGHGGIMPAQFAPQQGLYDQWRAKKYWEARQTALTTASAADRETYVQMLKGMAQMRGTPWGLEQQRSANIMASDVAFMAPALAQAMPEMFDLMHGTRGSATVMASFLHRGGLTAVDAATGRTGYTGETAGALAAEMHRRFFGPDADIASWRGLSAGRAGMLYDELQQRGLMGTSIGALTRQQQFDMLRDSGTSREDVIRMVQQQDPARFQRMVTDAGAAGRTGDDQIRAIAQANGVAETALREIQKSQPGQFDALLRQFDANRIGNRLKDMSGAVAAMREIFGDLGKPNAPMTELIQGLNDLTQGGLATMNPAELERTVRTTQVIARTSGMGMQAFGALQAAGVDTARRMGLDDRFGVLASQTAAEFGAAYGQVGGGAAGGWGRADRDTMTRMNQQLTLNAAASPMANQLAAMMRIGEMEERAGRAPGGEMAAIMQAVREGRSTFTNAAGQEEGLRMNEARWRQIVQAQVGDAGMNNAMVMLRSSAGQRETIARYRIDEIARGAQGEEIQRIGQQAMNEAVVGVLGRTMGGDRRRMHAMADVTSRAMAEAAVEMDPETRRDEATRNQFMIDRTRAAVTAQLRAENPAMTEEQANAEFNRMFPAERLPMMMATGWSRAQERFARDPNLQRYGGENGWIRALDANNRLVENRRRFLKAENQAQVAIGTALGGMGQASWIARLMDEVQKPSDNIGDAVKKVLGGVDPNEVRRRLAGIDPNEIGPGGLQVKERLAVMAEEMLETTRRYNAIRDDPRATEAQRLAAVQDYTRQVTAINQGGPAARAEIRRDLEASGILAKGASDDELREAVRQIRTGDTKNEKIKGLPQAMRDKILRYSVMGATADDAAIKRQQEEILKGEVQAGRITEKELAAARAGSDPEIAAKLSPDARMRLQALAVTRAGLAGASAAEGMNLGAQVGEKQLASVERHRVLLERAIAQGEPAAGPAGDRARAERQRHAERIVEDQKRWLDTLLGDTPSMQNLGKGGFDLASGAMGKVKEMDRLAEGLPVTVADIISGKAIDTSKMSPEQQKAVERIKELNKEVRADSAKLVTMMKRTPGKDTAMTPEEVKAHAEYRAKATQPDDERSKTLVGDIVKGMGGRALTADEQAQAVAAIGRGPESEKLRYALEQRFGARTELQEMAKKRGITLEQLTADVEGSSGVGRLFGMAAVSGEDYAKAQALMKKAGAAAEGDEGLAAITSAIDQEKREKAAKAEGDSKAAAGAGGGKMAMSGRVTVDIQNGTMDMSGAHGQMGSTPVAG
jgi:hypothetical protein